jgi:trk system potassium uptake protein
MSIGDYRGWVNSWTAATERRRSFWRRLTPPQLFVVSFAGLIVLGTVGFLLLPGLYTGERIGFVDALYMATSAACITGLTVVNVSADLTFWGQLYLLTLFQLGGLGMITFTTMIIIALGRRLSLRHESLTRVGSTEVAPNVNLERLAKDVFRFTFTIEGIGAVFLYALFVPEFGVRGAVWPAIFQAVSAFCNAGFSSFQDSLIGFADQPAVLTTIMTMVVLGGIGFLTLEELAMWRRAEWTQRGFNLSLHSRLVLVATAVLVAVGAVAFAAFEWANLLAHHSLLDRIVNALFMSTTPRSGGFVTVDYAAATESTNFLTILLMFIGGSPGSTGGGIKTTTFLLLGLLALSRFRGREVVSAWGRSLPEETIQRAVGLVVVVFTAVTAGIFAFTWTERGLVIPDAFLSLMFEAVSAFNTVGLSMGVTEHLSDAGRVLSSLMMFVGRVGPLTFAAALALAARRESVGYRYAYEDVVVG